MTHPDYKKLFNSLEVSFESRGRIQRLTIGKNGYIGQANVLGSFALEIVPTEGTIILQINADKTVIQKRDLAQKQLATHGTYDVSLGGKYRLVFPTTMTLNNIICTKYSLQNDFRLVRIDEGQFQMWQLSVVSQDGKFFIFLTKQYIGHLQVSRPLGDTLFTPGLYVLGYPKLDPKNWPQLQVILKQLVEARILPTFNGHIVKPDKYQTNDSLLVNGSDDRLIGKVRWWNPALHYGLLEIYRVNKAKNQCRYMVNARVHESRLYGTDYPRILCAGDLLEIYDVSRAVTDTRGFGTKFNYEITDCSILKRGEVYKKSFIE